LAVVNAEDAHDYASRTGDDAVGEVAVGADENVAGKFADGDVFGGFLEFKDLLVDELGFFVDNEVGVERALVAVRWAVLRSGADSRECYACKAGGYA